MRKYFLIITAPLVAGILLACILVSMREPVWKAGVKMELYSACGLLDYPSDDPPPAPSYGHGESDISNKVAFLNSTYLANRVLAKLSEGNTVPTISRNNRHSPYFSAESLKQMREINLHRADYTVWVYCTDHDPQVAQTIADLFAGEAIAIESELMRNIKSPHLELMEAQLQQKEDSLGYLHRQLLEISPPDSEQHTLLKQKIHDGERLRDELKRTLEAEQGIQRRSKASA